MILYDHPLSPYSQKVRIMLREKGVDFDLRIPDGLGSGEDHGYSAHNPRLEVPALAISADETLFDSTIILEYLADRFPVPSFRPVDPLARAHAREIEEVCDTHYEAINWGLGELLFFGRARDQAEQLRTVAARETATLQAWLESRLRTAGWLTGETFGIADIAAIPFVTMSGIFGFPPRTGSPLDAWVGRMLERPAVRTTIDEAAAAVDGMYAYADMLDRGGMRRQFRDHRLEWMIRAGGLPVVIEGLVRDNVRFTDLGRFAR